MHDTSDKGIFLVTSRVHHRASFGPTGSSDSLLHSLQYRVQITPFPERSSSSSLTESRLLLSLTVTVPLSCPLKFQDSFIDSTATEVVDPTKARPSGDPTNCFLSPPAIPRRLVAKRDRRRLLRIVLDGAKFLKTVASGKVVEKDGFNVYSRHIQRSPASLLVVSKTLPIWIPRTEMSKTQAPSAEHLHVLFERPADASRSCSPFNEN
uniref:Uncharacterized protein n=1 Tax=Steinernema glaseri TaxID=37863 RepID=A0A1I8A1X1_9BILA